MHGRPIIIVDSKGVGRIDDTLEREWEWSLLLRQKKESLAFVTGDMVDMERERLRKDRRRTPASIERQVRAKAQWRSADYEQEIATLEAKLARRLRWKWRATRVRFVDLDASMAAWLDANRIRRRTAFNGATAILFRGDDDYWLWHMRWMKNDNDSILF